MTEATFFVDLETGEIRSKVVRSVAPQIRVRFNTFLKCVIGFVRDEVAEALADGTGVTLVVKPALGHTEAAVALDVTASESGDGSARRYEMQALVTGDALSGLLNGLDEAVFSLQVAWGSEGAAGYGISEPLEIVVVNAYVRPGDELPDPTGDAAWELLKDTFPQGTPDEVERTLEFDVGGVTDHGALSGLGDDDHAQYLNNERGDARYAPVGAATGTNTGDVTLAGAPNYLTIVGQVITRALINLASHVTGILGRANGGTGLSSAGATKNVLTSNGTTWVSAPPTDIVKMGAGVALSSVLKASTFQVRLQTHLGDGVPIGLYKDAACTLPATLAGDDVRGWKDVLSGSGFTLTVQSGDPAAKLRFFDGRPCVELNGLQLLGSTSSDIFFPSKRGTFYALTRNKGNGALVVGSTFTQGGQTFLIQAFEQGTNNFYFDGSFRTASSYQRGTFNLAAVRSTNTNLAVYNAGSLVQNITVGDVQPDSKKLSIGNIWNGSSTTPGGLSMGLFYALYFTVDGTLNAVVPELFSKLASYNVNIVCDGNSLTAGSGANNATAYPPQLETLLRATGRNDCVSNIGIGGQVTTAMTAKAAAHIDANWEGSPQKIVVAWECTNDLFFGTSAATAYSNFVSYCQARRAAGAQVVAVTVLPRSDAGTPGTFEASRQTVNTNIRANWATFADALADVAADTRIGDPGDELDTTYYTADKVHMNSTGYGVVAEVVKNAILTLP
jgi:lysophospholipase L1-like esterase